MKKYRPDLSDYEIYISVLTDRLNEQSLLKLSKTDTIKLLIEKAMKNYCPNIVVGKKRKLYQTLEF
jgi:hypothetical protein